MGIRSLTCASRSTGKPLMAYRSEAEAKSQARHSNEVYKQNLTHYQCIKCKEWHLKPSHARPAAEKWPR